MITRRLLVLLLIVAGGMSVVFLLPKSYNQPYGIVLNLPDYVGEWFGKKQDVTKKEREVLGKETEFARSLYHNPYSKIKDYGRLQVSIVLSGHDMSNSIHRPERCLTAQGWNLLKKTSTNIDVGNKGSFPITELYCSRVFTNNEGKNLETKSITCYWFAGAEEITGSHWSRWFIDNRDRFTKGVNQRWAFVLVTGIIPPTAPDQEKEAREWTEKMIRDFVAQLAPKIHGPTLSYE